MSLLTSHKKIATEVKDLLMNPLEENPYDVLKETLVKRTTLKAMAITAVA